MTDGSSPAAYERTELEAGVPERSESAEAVTVEIYDQVYSLRGIDPAYIEQLASSVDSKMRAVAEHGGTVDSLRVAVLAALNITDELQTLRARYEALAGSVTQTQRAVRSRAGSLSHLLDEVIDESAGCGLDGRRAG